MTEQPPIDPRRVLAALDALGWPDDRTTTEHPPGALYDAAEDAIRAADAAGCPCLPGAPAHRHGAGGRYTCSAGLLGDVFQLDERLHDDQCTTPVCAACGCWCHSEEQPTGPIADHPHTDPGDGRTECERCGKWIWPVIHSCKGVPVTDRARARAEPPCRDCGKREADHVDGRCPRYRPSAGRVDQAEG